MKFYSLKIQGLSSTNTLIGLNYESGVIEIDGVSENAKFHEFSIGILFVVVHITFTSKLK